MYVYETRPAFLNDPGLPFLYARDLLTDLGSPENQRKVAADPRVPVVRREAAIAMQNAGKMAAAGIPVALGTDAGPGAVLLGLADHLEMELLVQSGLSPLQALRAATINSAKVLGVDERYGTLERGKAANFTSSPRIRWPTSGTRGQLTRSGWMGTPSIGRRSRRA